MGFKCSNVIFLLSNGYLTEGMFVQHVDHNPFNNNPDNLRECTRSQNAQYSKLRKDNTSGHKGVFRTRCGLKWHVAVKLDGECHHFGTYGDKDEAARVAAEARNEMHGTFGRVK